MAKPTGFIEIQRVKPPARPIDERVRDWREVTLPWPSGALEAQAARCMDCGVPFCHQACPIGNVVPDWNDLVFRGQWRQALDRLQATNNFPEFTGRLCPAPCEGSCVLGIHDQPVAIKSVEAAIVERGFSEGWVHPGRPVRRTWRRVAVVGSGPAGLAAADELNRAGHSVTVFEQADRIGGLLRYGIPEFKMEKAVLDRRLALMEAAGVVFRPGVAVGVDVTLGELRRSFDAVLLAAGAGRPRDLRVPGRALGGIHFALELLTQQNRRCAGDAIDEAAAITAEDRRVVIIGGGDTGADCLGTVLRQRCRSVHQLELLPRPPAERRTDNPWPQWPDVFRVSSAHEEGGERVFSVSTEGFRGDADGRVRALYGRGVVLQDGRPLPVPETDFELEADLVLLAMGFTGPVLEPLASGLDLRVTERGNLWTDEASMTSVPGVFAAGDVRRGQSLIVWAIAEGRHAARQIDRYLVTRPPAERTSRLSSGPGSAERLGTEA